MKKLVISISLVLFSSFAAMAQDNFVANAKSSVINWKGFKPTGSHHGTILIKEGNFKFENNAIVGGEFTITMNSIVNLDLPADSKSNAKLVNHLKSADFFDVEKYPTSVFKITGTEKKDGKILIKGNLSMKDKTNPAEFLATVTFNGNNMEVKSETFTIDRSKWDVRYGSKSFFNDLADKFINDEMEISVDVKATK